MLLTNNACMFDRNMLATSPAVPMLSLKVELLNTKYPSSAVATTPPSTAKLLMNVQLSQLTRLCCSMNMTPPSTAVLFSNNVLAIVVVVSSDPANNTDPSSYQ